MLKVSSVCKNVLPLNVQCWFSRGQNKSNTHPPTHTHTLTHTRPGSVTWISAIIFGCHISLGSVTLQNLRLWEFHTLLSLSAEAVFPHHHTGKCCIAAFITFDRRLHMLHSFIYLFQNSVGLKILQFFLWFKKEFKYNLFLFFYKISF